MIKGVIFDMDGVLFDTEKLYERFWIEAASRYGFTMTTEDVASVRSTDANLARKILKGRLGEAFDYDEVKKLRIRLMQDFTRLNGIEVMEGVFELLRYLKEQDILTALATVSNRQRAEEFLKQGGISQYFDYIVAGDMVTNAKPDPEIYLKAAIGLGLPCESCIAVEDSYNGVRSAFRAGCRVIMVPDRDVPDDEMRKKCYRIVENCAQIIPYISEPYKTVTPPV